LTDFTLDDFRIDLLNFLENNRKQLEEAPFGLYALSPALQGNHLDLIDTTQFTESEQSIIQAGVVFCLRYRGENKGLETINPLQPYFLVYVRQDGTVRYNYANVKAILEILRLTCQGHQAPFEVLCSLFDQETNQGKKMDTYDQLLQKATAEIARLFGKKVAQNLQNSRSGVLVGTPKAEENNDFELITWLIIK
jgi:hypothetical protein